MKILNRFTGSVLCETDRASLYEADLRGADLRRANLDGANLYGANLRGANLRGADLGGADLRGANLRGANLRGANLYGANLDGANLYGADLYGANLRGADLRGASLRWANLCGATMPDGRSFEDFQKDPLAGICEEPEARDRAIKAWRNHTWKTCPMHCAFGWNKVEDAPEDKRLFVSAFVSIFDAKLLPVPT